MLEFYKNSIQFLDKIIEALHRMESSDYKKYYSYLQNNILNSVDLNKNDRKILLLIMQMITPFAKSRIDLKYCLTRLDEIQEKIQITDNLIME